MRQALIDVGYMFGISTVSVGVDDTALLKIIIIVPQTPGLHMSANDLSRRASVRLMDSVHLSTRQISFVSSFQFTMRKMVNPTCFRCTSV
jgi:hypothetical protein